ncbi:unnamed protein product [Dicrocoelium dendriticum]|nr:unnamed protein product [Dicrocoelium dendriticum]
MELPPRGPTFMQGILSMGFARISMLQLALRRCGKIVNRPSAGPQMYEVRCQNGLSIRHADHIQHRCTTEQIKSGGTTELPFHVLVDIFAFPRPIENNSKRSMLMLSHKWKMNSHSTRTRPPIQRQHHSK